MDDPSNERLAAHPGALRWGAILFTIAAGLMIWPLWQPLIMAMWFAILARPLMKTVSRVTRGKHRAAAVLTLLLLLLVLVPIVLFVTSLVSAAVELVETVLNSNGGKDAFEAIVSGGDTRTSLSSSDIVDLVRQYGERAIGVLSSVVGATAKGILGIFVFVLAAYTFLAEGPQVYAWIEGHLPIAPRTFHRYAVAFEETGRGLIVGVGLTSVIQGVTATIAYLALGIPRAFVLGVLTAIASLIPSVGTALVWGPVAVGLALTGRWVHAVIMAAIGVLVIGVADNLLRPMLSRHGSVQLPTFVLLVAMFGGLATVGAWGLVLGPLLVRLAVEAVSIEHDDRAASLGAVGPRPERGPDV